MRGSLALLFLVAACATTSDPEASSELAADAGPQKTDAGAIIDPAVDAGVDAAPVARPLPAVPFHTKSRWILDAKNERFKLASANWYGAESKDFVVAGLDKMPLATIAAQIRAAGLNSVRLPWSNELVESNPVVASARLAANPALAGKTALQVFDAVIAALAFEGLVVILDNHVSRAEWCCTEADGNGLWFTDAYPESSWLADWRTMVKRYRNVRAVVAADLRNELRGMPDGRKPSWGGSDAALDWRAAAKRGGDAVLAENPDLLVVVEGLAYATDLTGAYDNPLAPLSVPNRLVMSSHDYSWFHPALFSYGQLHTDLGNKWGFLLVQGQPFTAPVWVSEFGVAHSAAEVSSLWFESIRRYLDEADIDWCYWALNGTQSTGTTRTLGAEETFGILDQTWTKPASAELSAALTAIAPVKQTP